MTPLRPARRRAERFADLVDASIDGRRHDEDGVDRSTAELLELVGALRAAPPVSPRPEFVSDLRAQLMAAAETELVPAEASSPRERLAARRVDDRLTVAPRRRPRERRLAVAAGAFALIGATTSIAVASQSALPGQALYPLKRGIEDTHASLAIGDRSKGSVVLDNASDRLSEVRDLSREDGSDADTAARVTQTLHDFNEQVKQGSDLLIADYHDHHDAQSINTLRDFDATSVLTLSELDGVIPADSQSALVSAAKQLFLIDAAAGSLCPDCSSTGITEIPPTLLASGTLDGSALQSGTDGPLGSGPSAGPGGGPQTIPTDTVSIPPSLLPTGLPTVGPSASAAASSATAQPTSAASTGVLGGLLGGVLGGGGKGGKDSDKPTPTLPVNPSQAVSSATAAVSAVASAVGSAVGGVVSSAASGVGGLVDGTVGGLTGNQNK